MREETRALEALSLARIHTVGGARAQSPDAPRQQEGGGTGTGRGKGKGKGTQSGCHTSGQMDHWSRECPRKSAKPQAVAPAPHASMSTGPTPKPSPLCCWPCTMLGKSYDHKTGNAHCGRSTWPPNHRAITGAPKKVRGGRDLLPPKSQPRSRGWRAPSGPARLRLASSKVAMS